MSSVEHVVTGYTSVGLIYHAMHCKDRYTQPVRMQTVSTDLVWSAAPAGPAL